MKKRFLISGLIVLTPLLCFAQQIHTPAGIFKIMQKSPVTYRMMTLDENIPVPDRSENLIDHNYYRTVEDGNLVTRTYIVIDSVKEYLTKAEALYQDNQIVEARDMYLKALNQDTTFYAVMTYIGQMYEIEQNWNEAIKWYKKTISKNYIDYMAHWFLADAYRMTGQIDKAVDEITIAKILNRNNPRLQNSLTDIYKLKKLHYSDFIFNPQIRIDSTGVNKVDVASGKGWLGYAMVKAVWKYEPGYKESMGVKSSNISTLEEKEAIVALMTSGDKKTLKKSQELKAVKLAIDKGMIDDYILYEIFLPDHPFVACQLSEDLINNIKDYIIRVRSKVK